MTKDLPITINEAKSALLARIVEGDEVVDAAGAYQMLVMAECHERMTELQTRDCDCPDCKPPFDEGDEILT